jgi:2-polyprenyl-3-methyl-5-hydroxy-6-metoxy-1,4-benzoquinol methylase
MQLMLWMASEVSGHRLHRDTFVDVGANIGSCSVHMAALGFPVISVEPVLEHVCKYCVGRIATQH